MDQTRYNRRYERDRAKRQKKQNKRVIKLWLYDKEYSE
jgi:hypothetical protein